MTSNFTRRTLLKSGAVAAAASSLPLLFARGAHAAGKLNVAFWDHWVPGANDVLTKLCNEWAAEAQAKSGHDMITLPGWYGPAHTEDLENANDVWDELIKRHGPTTASMTYVGRQDGHWIAPPAIPNTLTLPSVGRIDVFKDAVGLDLTQMYP